MEINIFVAKLRCFHTENMFAFLCRYNTLFESHLAEDVFAFLSLNFAVFTLIIPKHVLVRLWPSFAVFSFSAL